MSIIKDWLLERRIKRARMALLAADAGDRAQRCAEFKRLIRMRSPQQVGRMERERWLI